MLFDLPPATPCPGGSWKGRDTCLSEFVRFDYSASIIAYQFIYYIKWHIPFYLLQLTVLDKSLKDILDAI